MEADLLESGLEHGLPAFRGMHFQQFQKTGVRGSDCSVGQEKGEGWLWGPVGRLGVHGYVFLGRHTSFSVSVNTGGGVGV